MDNRVSNDDRHAQTKTAKRPHRGWWITAILLGTVVVSIGCNPLTAAYFIFVPNPHFPPDEFDFTDEKRNPKIVIVASHATGNTMTTQLFNADQLLAKQFAKDLTEAYKDNRESVQVVSPIRVQEFKSQNPDWKSMALDEIGKHFKADFVVSLEINKLSLYEKNSNMQLYRGNAEISVVVVNVNKPEASEVVNKHFVSLYPNRGPEVTDHSPGHFRARFISRMSRDLTCWLAPYPTEAKQSFD